MIILDRLVNVLGDYGVRLNWSSVPRSTELRSVVIHETTGNRAVVGDVLLAIGADTVTQAVHWAASARAAVVLLRGDGQEVTFDGASEALAIMVVDEEMAWSEVAAVVYGLVLEGRETESGRGPTDLFALADSLADAIGGAVVIHDRLLRVCWRIRGSSSTPTLRGWRRSWNDRHRNSCAHSFEATWSLRPPGGLRRSTVRRRGGRTWHERAHGGGGALGTRTHRVGVGRVLGAAGRGRSSPPWPMARTRWPYICCGHEPARTWSARSNPNW